MAGNAVHTSKGIVSISGLRLINGVPGQQCRAHATRGPHRPQCSIYRTAERKLILTFNGRIIDRRRRRAFGASLTSKFRCARVSRAMEWIFPRLTRGLLLRHPFVSSFRLVGSQVRTLSAAQPSRKISHSRVTPLVSSTRAPTSSPRISRSAGGGVAAIDQKIAMQL